jgi:hypothetical protein
VLNPILLNTANVLYVFCFGVRDVLWLRILAIAAMMLLLPFYANQIEPMISCMIWQIVFIAINAYWVVVIIRERLPPKMTDEEQELYDNVFKNCCSARDMLKLISHAQWCEVESGTKVIEAQTPLNELVLVHSGSVAFQIKEKEVINFHMGSLLGAVSFFRKKILSRTILPPNPFVTLPGAEKSWTICLIRSLHLNRRCMKSSDATWFKS